MNWEVYLNGVRQQRYLLYISRQAAEYYAQSLSNRNINRGSIYFVAMEMRLLEDEVYNGLRFY